MPTRAPEALAAKTRTVAISRTNMPVRKSFTLPTLNTGRPERCGPPRGERRISARPKYHWARERAPPPRARSSLGDAHLRRPLRCPALERALPGQPGQGPDRPLGCLRPADADGL